MIQPSLSPQIQGSPQQPHPLADPVKHYVHHAYIWLGILRVAFSLAIVVVASLFPLLFGRAEMTANDTIQFGLFGAGFAALLIILLAVVSIMQYFSYKNLYYMLDDEEFSLYSGIFNKKKIHVPYQRIQSVNQKASLIQRIVGVCIVHIDTAGGSLNKAIIVPYLQNTEAEKLRAELFARKQYILSQQGATTAQITEVPTQGAQSSNVLDAPAEIMTDIRGIFGDRQINTGAVSYEYGLSNKELIFSSLSNNTGFILLILAIFSGFLGLAGQFMNTPLGEAAYQSGVTLISRVFAGQIVWAIAGSLIIAFLVIWVISIIATCISYGGFKAVRRQNRIEIEHGLLQHTFHGVDVDRVQSVIIKQSFIRRLIGYCELSLGKINATSDNANDQERNLNRQGLVVHPFVKIDKVPEILAGLIPEFAEVPQETIRLPRVALRRGLIRRCILKGNGLWLAIIVLIIQGGAHFFSTFEIATVNRSEVISLLPTIDLGAYVLYGIAVVILVLEAINTVLWYKGSSFGYNKAFMQVSNGGFSRESVSFPRKKIQFGFTKTNPFQRMSKVATINARTAAGIGGTTMRLLDVDEEAAQKWLAWVIPGNNMIK